MLFVIYFNSNQQEALIFDNWLARLYFIATLYNINRCTITMKTTRWRYYKYNAVSYWRAVWWMRRNRKRRAHWCRVNRNKVACSKCNNQLARDSNSKKKGFNKYQLVTLKFKTSYLIEFFLGYVGLAFVAESLERAFNFFTGLNIFGFATNHEGHVFLQWYQSIPK